MADYATDVTAISSKGQVVIPKNIRDSLELMPGTRMIIFTDGNNILLKPLEQPNINEFRDLMDSANQWAKDVGMTSDDIDEAIKNVRKNRRSVFPSSHTLHMSVYHHRKSAYSYVCMKKTTDPVHLPLD
jgi:antitoxin PrlF